MNNNVVFLKKNNALERQIHDREEVPIINKSASSPRTRRVFCCWTKYYNLKNISTQTRNYFASFYDIVRKYSFNLNRPHKDYAVIYMAM